MGIELRPDGLEVGGLFRKSRRIPFEDIASLDDGEVRLGSGGRLRVGPRVEHELGSVLRGPELEHRGLDDLRDALAAYLAQPWSAATAVRALLRVAEKLGASDVHLEPSGEGADVRLRLAGELRPFLWVCADAFRRLGAALKHLSGCLPYRSDIVQEGRIPRPGVCADVRASFVPAVFGDRIALRLFGQLLRLDELGLADDTRARFERALSCSHGLVLVAGASGAGKTTTLYAALAHLGAVRKGAHLSLEDPIEQRLRLAGIAVDQLELCPERGLSGEAALVAALRQDVDVVALGEVRTPAEAALAVKAAHTGRLVLAGVHAGDAKEARVRLLDLGVDGRLLEETVVGVLHQRLRVEDCLHRELTCPRCRGVGRRRRAEAEVWLAEEGRR